MEMGFHLSMPNCVVDLAHFVEQQCLEKPKVWSNFCD